MVAAEPAPGNSGNEAAILIRECIYSLQGIDGDRLRFYDGENGDKSDENDNSSDPLLMRCRDQQGIQIRSSTSKRLLLPMTNDNTELSSLGSGALDAIKICCEAGWLYRRIRSYVDSILLLVVNNNANDDNNNNQQQQNAGSVARAFAMAVDHEMRSYRALLLTLSTTSASASDNSNSSSNNVLISLRELLVKTRPATTRLKTIAMLTDAVRQGHGQQQQQQRRRRQQHLSGPRLLTALHQHCRHGDTRHATLTRWLFAAAARPWYGRLILWITQGVLTTDPAAEFFIATATAATAATATAGHDQDGHDGQTADSLPRQHRELWRDGYVLDRGKVPDGVLSADLIDPAFLVGKGINYIRICLRDDDWSMEQDGDEVDAGVAAIERLLTAQSQEQQQQSQSHKSHTSSSSSLDDVVSTAFRATLTLAATRVHSHILACLEHEHHLRQHLFALKQFLLLGQGDFYAALMDGLQAEFGHHAASSASSSSPSPRSRGGMQGIYHRHTVEGVVETALRSTNANAFPPYILERLHVKLVFRDQADEDARYMFGPGYRQNSKNMDKNHDNAVTSSRADKNDDNNNNNNNKRSVWDIFRLEYTVPDSLVAIIHPHALERYNALFTFLFGLKKVAFLIHFTWRQSAALQHALQISAQSKAISVRTSTAYAQALVLLRQVSMLRQAIIHFVVNLKSYLMFEVLEGDWTRLIHDIDHARTLDEVIAAHDAYLQRACRKCLCHLSSSSASVRGGAPDKSSGADDTTAGAAADDDSTSNIGTHIHALSDLAGEFCSYQEELFGEALEAADRAAAKRRAAESRSDEGDWGFSSELEVTEEESFFGLADPSKLEELDRLSEAFNTKMVDLLQALDRKLHGGPVLAGRGDDGFESPTLTTPPPPSAVDAAVGSGNSLSRRHHHVTTVTAEEEDLDSLRFLAFQLDHNQYYGMQAS